MKPAKTKGIVLLALGHKMYGNYAANLASSLRFNYRDIPIHLAYAGNAIDEISKDARMKLFSSVAEIPQEYYTTKGKPTFIKAKNYLYQLSPFDCTLFLDVDIIMTPRNDKNTHDGIGLFFDEMESKNIDFTMANRDFLEMAEAENNQKYSIWANVHEVAQAYKIKEGRYYSCHSEFIYFTKCKANEKFFKLAEEISENIKVKHADFGGGIPDELPFAIAMAKLKHYPHATPFIKIYWHNAERSGLIDNLSKLYNQFLGISWGGNATDKSTIRAYNLLSEFYAKKHYIPYQHLIEKKKWAEGRQNRI